MSEKLNCAYILAGGESRRMGQDKLFLGHDKTTLLERVLTLCQKHFDLVKISAKDKDKFENMNVEVVTDWPGAEGPLSGIIASLKDCRDGICFVTAVDLIDLNDSIINKMKESYNGEQYLGLKEHGQYQPLCGIYNKSSLKYLCEQADKGNYTMQNIIAGLECNFIDVESKTWRNINRPEDLAELR